MSLMREVRRERLERLVPMPSGLGLEIGPLADPLFLIDEAEIRYVDVLDQAGLRGHYRDDPSVNCDDIPVMDYTLTTERGVVTLAEAVGQEATYQYVAACHVIEHVPDVVGWLADIAEIVVDDGLVLLVVPDKRFCFDYFRQQTSVGQMLQAAQARDRTPSIRAVYDHFRQAATVSTTDVWDGISPTPLDDARLYPLELTLGQVERARAGHYVDGHVWTFTPETFVEQVSDLALLDLSDFAIEALLPTPQYALEFYAVLRRIPRDSDPAARREMGEAARARAREIVSTALRPRDPLAEDPEQLRAHLQDCQARLDEAERELEAIRRSRQWRMGGAAMWPLRQVRRASRRLTAKGGTPPP